MSLYADELNDGPHGEAHAYNLVRDAADSLAEALANLRAASADFHNGKALLVEWHRAGFQLAELLELYAKMNAAMQVAADWSDSPVTIVIV